MWLLALTLLAIAEPTHTLRVATYNTWLLPLASDDLASRATRIPAALSAQDADLLCLQEVWYTDAIGALRVALSPRLPFVVVGGGGLMTASRWPILHTEFVPFADHPETPLLERFAKKGWLETVLLTPAGPLRVLNTHLVWEGHPPPPPEKSVLRAQLDALQRALAHREVPTLVCGDLNHRAVASGQPTDAFRGWLALGFTDTLTRPDSEGRWPDRPRTRVGYPRGAHIPPRGGDPDYILVRPGARGAITTRGAGQALDTPETALSDHNLLWVELELSR